MRHSVPAGQVVPADPADLVVPAVPADLVVPVDSRIAQLDPVAQVDPVILVVPVVPAVPAVPVAVAPVHALVRADQRPARLGGLEASLHVAVNRKGPNVKSLTIWKHPRWVGYVCHEEMATASDFHAVPA